MANGQVDLITVVPYLDFKFLENVKFPAPIFLYFCLSNTVDKKQIWFKSLLMAGFEPQTSGV